MRIYELTENGNQIRFHYHATKHAAEAHIQELKKDNANMEYQPTYDLTTFDVAPTRAGIADALNWLISRTCWNE